MLLLKGCFLTLGERCPPSLPILAQGAWESLHDRLAIARSDDGRRRAYAFAFGNGVEYAIPAWDADALALVASDYTGPWQDEMRALALLVLRGGSHGGRDGGQQAVQAPQAPRGPAPAGALFPELAAAGVSQ